MLKFKVNNQYGFTLIELVIVMVLLGVLSVGVSSFLKFGTQIYSETSARDQIISSARFAVERLNRELRHALPNSIRLKNASQCIEFIPIVESTIYTEIPVAPELATNEMTVIKFDDSLFNNTLSAVVYPLSPNDLYNGTDLFVNNGKIFGVDSITDNTSDEWTVSLDGNIQFPQDSPTNRLFFIKDSVSYCLTGSALTREGILMAESIINVDPFEVIPATLQRNSIVQVRLTFENNTEQVTFNNEIQVPNVP
ncbi:MAG: type II secretion system protein [Colwelliaceae bacterium]|jgi:MSHA biogenesis protein MshO|nr:type II secretion system protein [Colwelliaceae bacterium]